MSNCSSRVKCPLHITFALQLQAFRIYRSSGGSNNKMNTARSSRWSWKRRRWRRCRILRIRGRMQEESNNGRAEISSPASLTTRSIAAARCGKNRDVTRSGWVVVGWLGGLCGLGGWGCWCREGQVESNIYCLQSLVYYFTCISLASFRSRAAASARTLYDSLGRSFWSRTFCK